MEPGGTVVAQLADVTSLQAPLLAGDHSRCHLSARKDGFFAELDFGTWRGEAGDGDYRIRSIQADADQVNLRRIDHLFTVNEKGGLLPAGPSSRGRLSGVDGQKA